MSRWFRHYAGLAADPKFGGIARRSKTTRERVVFVWCCLLESAAETNAAGVYVIDADSIADLLSCETEAVEAILAQFSAAGLLADGKLAKWSLRQFESDTSASRTRRYREKKRHGDDAVTSQNGDVTPPETETEIELELPIETPASNPEKPEADNRAAASRSARAAKEYVFEAGIIRLIARDFDRWEKAWPNISLRGELEGLAGAAQREHDTGGSWFHMCAGALAKRDREARLAVESIKANALAQANAPVPKKPAYLGP